MTVSLSTHLHRSLFALPLLAIGLLGARAVDAPTAVEPAAAAATIAFVAPPGCDAEPRQDGARALARMPGDIGPLAARIRCAQ